jgi:hypothetical protein
MDLTVLYPAYSDTAAPRLRSAAAVWAVAAQVRRQLAAHGVGRPIDADVLMALAGRIDINGRQFEVYWDADHEVHDDLGRPVFGVCETDRDSPEVAYVSINGPLLSGCPDLVVSTAAHELGHVIFDVPAGHRCYRAVTASADALLSAERSSEWRANEFMGALLVPPVPLHRELLRHARSEGLRLKRAPHHGRRGCPVVDPFNDPDALAGVGAVLGQEFGVSERFIDIRLRRYGLIAGMGGQS